MPFDIDVQLTGQDGNIFNLLGIAGKALRRAGETDAEKQMCKEVFASQSYEEALNIIGRYVNVS